MKGGVSGLSVEVWERISGQLPGNVRVRSSEGLWRPHRKDTVRAHLCRSRHKPMSGVTLQFEKGSQ